MNDGIRAHGRAAHAVLSWLHGRPVKGLSLGDAPAHFGMREPKTSDQTEEASRLLLSVPVGEMLHVGGSPDQHVTADRAEVQKALSLAARLGPGDPVDHLEPIYQSVIDTLTSPRIWRGVQALAGGLLAHRAMTSDRVAAVLRGAIMRGEAKGAVFPMTRRITVLT